MKKSSLLIVLSFIISQSPISDQGLDQIVGPGDVINISGANSYGVDGNTITSYQWTIPQEVEDVNPGIDLGSEILTFTAPNVSASTIYTISLTVTDNVGNTSQEYDSPNLILTEFCEVGTGNSSANRYLEIYNGTGSAITSDEWQNYEVWIAKSGADFMNEDQDFWAKLFFHRTATEDDANHDLDVGDITTIFPDDLEHEETLVLVKELADADSDITEHNTIEWGDLTRAAGDDGVALAKNALPIDTIGEGDDPGSGWEVAGEGNATKDHVLVRKSDVALGNYLDWDSSAGTNADDSEWIVLNHTEFSFVGSHDCTVCDNVVNVIVAIPPIANAGDDFVTCDEIVTLNGSGNASDIDYTYSWEGPGAVPLTGADTQNPTFTPPTALISDADYEFELIINDGYVDSEVAIVTVTVQANLCPVADAGEDVRYRVNTVNNITLSAANSYDPNENDFLSYEWELLSENTSLILTADESSLVISNLPDVLIQNPTQYQVELTVVDDGNQVSSPDTINVVIGDFAAPDSPNLYAVAYSDYVKLSWDFISESSLDPLTQYSDFEGYKLYKSEDGGQTWCSPEDKIYDFDGNEVGCHPFVQFDLTEDQDDQHCVYKEGYTGCESLRGENITEYDPESEWLYLGSNSGLEHIYIDEDVIDGMEYTYILTAYDMGVRTYSIDYEYLEDSETGEPIYQQVTNWSPSNPDQWTSVGQSQVSLDVDENYGVTYIESSLGEEGDNNFVQVVPGSLPVNISDPPTDTAESYIIPNSNNIGNASRSFDIVDKASIKDTHLKFEIQAEYGVDEGNIINSFEGNECENPTLYVWETDEAETAIDVNEIPITTELSYSDMILLPGFGLPGWGLSEDMLTIAQLILDSGMDIDFNEDPSEEQYELLLDIFADAGILFISPNYLVEDMLVTFSDELGADQNWTDLIYGVRFKFDNGYLYYESAKEGDQYIPSILDAYTEEANGDSTLMTSLFISDDRSTEIMYYSQQIFDMRPPYKYMIEFSDEPEYPAYDCFTNIGATNCGCTDAEGGVPSLPFQITNLTTEQPVSLRIKDNGLNDGISEDDDGEIVQNDPDLDGRKDCFWTRSERVLFKEIISTYYTSVEHLMSTSYPNEDNYTYELNLDYFMFREYNTDFWDENYNYQEGEQVLYQSMIWEASNIVPNNIPPPSGSDENGRKGWFDCGEDLKCNEDEEGYDIANNPDPEGDDYDSDTNPTGTEGDGLNNNPWVPVYPWKDGDKFYFTPIAWYADGDNWMVDLGQIGYRESVTQENVDNVYVAPNPYRGESSFDSVYEEETIYFKNLPSPCDISIYTVTGKLVDEFNFVDTGGAGQYPWHLTNSSGDKIAPGLYIFYVESESFNHVGKFAIVR